MEAGVFQFQSVKSAPSAVPAFDRPVSPDRFPHPPRASQRNGRSTSPGRLLRVAFIPRPAMERG